MFAILALFSSLSSTATAAEEPVQSSREFASSLRKDWDLLGLEIDATSSHTLAMVGPRYQGLTRTGLYIDASAGVGFSVRDNGPSVFGQGHGYVGWSIAKGLKNKKTLFNLYQTNSTSGTMTETTYHYLETEVIAQRNVIVYGGARSILGRGPDLADGSVAPNYVSFAGGLAFLTTWRQVKDMKGEKRLLRGVQGVELTFLYAPQTSASTNFSNFRHFGGEFRYTKTAELGRIAAPFHLGLGIEPGLGPMVRLGMLWPVMSPLAGNARAKVGEVR